MSTFKGFRGDLDPGTVIRRVSTGELILIGDTNTNGGGCDCCSDFLDDDEEFEIVAVLDWRSQIS